MLAQKRDEDRALELAHRMLMRATRHQRATDEEADLRMDLAAIAGDAEELGRMLGEADERAYAPGGWKGWEAISSLTEGIRFEYQQPESGEPEIGLSWGRASLMDVMEEAVQARERAEDKAEDARRFEALVLLGESAQAVHESRKPYVLNGSVYMVGKAAIEQLGEDLARYLAHRKRYVARKTAENRERRSNG